MVTSEGNRIQPPTATPFDRPTQTQTLPAFAGIVTQAPRGEAAAVISVRDPFWFMSLVATGATIGSLGGLGASVLGIIGLSGMLPQYMLLVAGIVLGLAFVVLGAVDTAWARMVRFTEHGTSRDRTVFFSGMAATMIAGFAAVVLGILNSAFLGYARFGAGAVVVLGLGLLWHSWVMRRVSRFTHDVTFRGVAGDRLSGLLAINALSLAPLRDFLFGFCGLILGLLAMLNIAPVVLGLVALLAMGGALTFTASTICGAAMTTLEGIGVKI